MLADYVIQNYFFVVVTLTAIGIVAHFISCFLGFDEDWSVFTFLGKGGSIANLAVVFPLYRSLEDPQVFATLKGHDAVVILACVCISYLAISNLVPKFLKVKIQSESEQRFRKRMQSLEGSGSDSKPI